MEIRSVERPGGLREEEAKVVPRSTWASKLLEDGGQRDLSISVGEMFAVVLLQDRPQNGFGQELVRARRSTHQDRGGDVESWSLVVWRVHGESGETGPVEDPRSAGP